MDLSVSIRGINTLGGATTFSVIGFGAYVLLDSVYTGGIWAVLATWEFESIQWSWIYVGGKKICSVIYQLTGA